MSTHDGGQAPRDRIEVTIDLDDVRGLEAIDKLDLDRLPDPEGRVRALVSDEDLARLKEAGFGVQVGERIPVAPLDPSLVFTDDDAETWLRRRLDGVSRENGGR